MLTNLPTNTGMAFVLVMHLAPKNKSLLTELLSRRTRMPVQEIRNRTPVKINHVYVIPPGRTVTVAGGKLILKRMKAIDLSHMPVDCFFKSLAAEHGNRSIGVIMSGTATDGTLGAEVIKAEGGIVFAQDKISARYGGMPQSAIAAGCVDFVLSPQKIAGELGRIARHPHSAPANTITAQSTASKNRAMEGIFDIVRAAKGLDFTHYKAATVLRRISRRMVLLRLKTLKLYARYLRNHKDEAEKLYEDLLINVTRFFRDPKVFDALTKQVFPEILKDKTRKQGVRIWVPGCSSGEEAYSIAMCLVEVLGRKAGTIPVQIFATDISDRSITRARRGIYSAAIKDAVTPERLKRFFTRVGDSYKVSKQLREMCVFSRQNVFSDPPFSNADLISCRNVLIYFQPTLQKTVFHKIHYALRPGGFLLLGSSESAGSYSALFKILDKNQKIFVKKHLPGGLLLGSNLRYHPPMKMTTTVLPKKLPKTRGKPGHPEKNVAALRQELAETKEYLQRVVEEQEGANEELQSTNEELETAKEELQSLNEELVTTNEELQVRNSEISLLNNDLINLLGSISMPIVMMGTDLVIRRVTPQAEKTLNIIPSDIGRPISKIKLAIDIPDFEKTLFDVIESLRPRTLEIQSASGEWYSVHIRPYRTTDNRIDGVVAVFVDITERKMALLVSEELREFSEKIVETVREPLIVLSDDLKVVFANRSFYRTFKVTPKETKGQFIYELGNHQWDIPKLRELLEDILPAKSSLDNYEITHTFESIGQRVMLLNAHKLYRNANNARMILLAIEDITDRRSVEKKVKDMTDTKSRFTTMVSHELRTPLTVIIECINLILDGLVGEVSDEQKECLNMAKGNSDRLARMINDVLNFQKMSSGKMEYDIHENCINAAIQEVCKSMATLAGEKGLDLAVELDADLPKAEFDRDKIVQVLTNLINNALKFTETGTISITSRRDDDGVHVMVQDTGPGIKAADLPKLFQTFEQLDSGRGKKRTGTGLGLAISKEIVLAHHGKIWAESAVGKGTTLHFTLPATAHRDCL